MSFLYRYAADETPVRKLDEATRSATFVAATERAVPMGWGAPEVLRMSGVDLKRFKSNPVVLNTHARYSLESILGTAKVEKVGRELHATITFDDTPEGEAAWRRVKSGSLRALSVGYTVDAASVRHLRDGETDGTGEAQVSGPASIVRKWQLMEISVVPVPADQDALVRRSLYSGAAGRSTRMEFSTLPVAQDAPPQTSERTAPTPPPAPVAPLAEEIAARKRAAINAQIRDMAGTSLREEAEACILEGLDVEAARARLKAARQKPVGTPEPVPTPTTNTERADGPLPAEITDDVFVRSFLSMGA